MNAKMIKEKDDNALLGVYVKPETLFVKGEGSWLIDDTGKRYLDFGAGIAVNQLGHNFEPITRAIAEQSQKLIHLSNLYVNETQVELAELLLEACPAFDKVFFCNSGTEANEALLKFARHYWVEQGFEERIKVISFNMSFHGRTLGALSLTGQKGLRDGFGSLPLDVIYIDWNDAETLNKHLEDNTIAAILCEPIQAEGGIRPLSLEMVKALHSFRLQNGALLLGDEIQVAMGRIGTVLGSNFFGFKPDMVTLAKPIGGGLPLGAVLLPQKVADTLKPGAHGTTFGGNPVACAAGVQVLKEILKPGFLEDSREVSALFKKGLENLAENDSNIEAVVGEGFILGIKCSYELPVVIAHAKDEGLIVLRAGGDVIRFVPAINVTKDEVELALKIMERVLAKLS
jgi:acetylornithine/N-succinyldiaminopimelate aminotransferase